MQGNCHIPCGMAYRVSIDYVFQSEYPLFLLGICLALGFHLSWCAYFASSSSPSPSRDPQCLALHNRSVSIHSTAAPGINKCLDVHNFTFMHLLKKLFCTSANHLKAQMVTSHGGFLHDFTLPSNIHFEFQPPHLLANKIIPDRYG